MYLYLLYLTTLRMKTDKEAEITAAKNIISHLLDSIKIDLAFDDSKEIQRRLKQINTQCKHIQKLQKE